MGGTISKLLNALQQSGSGAGRVARGAVLPAFGIAAAAPVVGYELDQLRHSQPPEEQILNKASSVVRQSLMSPAEIKLANLDGIRQSMQAAKARARGSRRLGFTQGEVKDTEQNDTGNAVSTNPHFRS